jgi:RIO kinase 1
MSFDLTGFATDEPTLDPLDGIDPRFTFDFQAYTEPGDGQRWSTWFAV